MTPKQKEILAFIIKHREKTGQVPSSAISAKKFGMSRQGMDIHYHALIDLNKIKKNPVVAHYLLV
jgi:hypothetical protein